MIEETQHLRTDECNVVNAWKYQMSYLSNERERMDVRHIFRICPYNWLCTIRKVWNKFPWAIFWGMTNWITLIKKAIQSHLPITLNPFAKNVAKTSTFNGSVFDRYVNWTWTGSNFYPIYLKIQISPAEIFEKNIFVCVKFRLSNFKSKHFVVENIPQNHNFSFGFGKQK